MSKVQISEAVREYNKDKIVKTDEGWIIRDVVLLSEFSKNSDPSSGKQRRYTRETQEKACKLFADVPVNVNHMRRSDNKQERDVRETIGKVTAPRTRMLKRDGKIEYQTIGDIVLVACESANQIAGLAKLNPKGGPGMSLTGDGAYDVHEDYANVIDLEPATVDVVATPATTRNFFEGVQPVAEGFPPKKPAAGAPDKKPVPPAGGDKPAPDAQGDAGAPAKPAGKNAPDVPGAKHDAAMGKGAPTDDQKQPKDGAGAGAPADPNDPNAQPDDPNAQGADANPDEAGEGQDAVGAGNVDKITAEANMATDTANSDKTAEAHFGAMFAHMLAAGQIYQMGNMARAKAHADKARQHEGIALNLKQNDANQTVTAAPPRPDAKKTTDGVPQTGGDQKSENPDDSAKKKLNKKPFEGCEPWVAKLFETC